MPPRRVDLFDKFVISICLLWLFGWSALGVFAATDIFWEDRDQHVAAVNTLVVLVGIGGIALIGLWPHRWMLRRRDEPEATKGHGFEVKRR